MKEYLDLLVMHLRVHILDQEAVIKNYQEKLERIDKLPQLDPDESKYNFLLGQIETLSIEQKFLRDLLNALEIT